MGGTYHTCAPDGRLGARRSVIAKLAVIEYGALVLREECSLPASSAVT